jgi:hypothetical protein
MSSPTSMSRPYSGYEELSLSDNEPEPASHSSPTAAHARQNSHPSSISYANDWTSPSSPSAQATDTWQSHPLASHTSHQPDPSGPSSPPDTGRASSLASLSASSSRPVPSSGASVSRTTMTTTATSPSDGTLVLGVAVVDFNHLVCPSFSCPTHVLLVPICDSRPSGQPPCSVFSLEGSRTWAWADASQIGPTVEFAYPPTLQLALHDDEALGRLLPFLALPDGAHLVRDELDSCAVHMDRGTGSTGASTLTSSRARRTTRISCVYPIRLPCALKQAALHIQTLRSGRPNQRCPDQHHPVWHFVRPPLRRPPHIPPPRSYIAYLLLPSLALSPPAVTCSKPVLWSQSAAHTLPGAIASSPLLTSYDAQAMSREVWSKKQSSSLPRTRSS